MSNDNYNTNEKENKTVKLTNVMRNSGSICVNKDLIRFMNEGSGTGLIRATVLTEIISKYEMWENKGDLQSDDSFFYTADELENDTGISPYTQKTNVFPYLEKLGLLKRESKRHPNNPMKKVRFIKLNIEACTSLFLEVIPLFKEKLETEKQAKNTDKQRHTAMVENQPSERVKINRPNGRKSTSSNTVLSNTELNNINTPLTPQQKENETTEHKTNEVEKQGKGQNDITRFIVNNFNKEQQAMLLSIYQNENKPKEFDQYFLSEYKKAYSKVQQDKKDLRLIKNKLIELINDMTKGEITIKKSLSGLMIYRFNNDRPIENKEQYKSNEIVPDWFEERRKERHRKIETSYETDYSKYDFNQMGNTDWLDDDIEENY